VWLAVFAPRHLAREIEPGERVADSADFVTHTPCRVRAHVIVQIVAGPELIQVLRDGIRVTHFDEEAAFVVLDLERNAADTGGDERSAFVQGLRQLYLETFTGGELQCDAGFGEEGVKYLAAGRGVHDTDVRFKVTQGRLEILDYGIVNENTIGVVDRTMSAYEAIRWRYLRFLLAE
jgi:hypothetical protein